MLPEPPCISGLVGCDASDFSSGGSGFGGSGGGSSGNGGGSSGSTGGGSVNVGGSLNLGGSLDASGLRNGVQNGLNGLGNGASALGTGIGSAGSRLGSAVGTAGSNLAGRVAGLGTGASSALGAKAQKYADYILTATNRGKDALKNIVLTHGPLPSGAVFDPSRSSKDCKQVGTSVECLTSLNPGESKDFTLSYLAKNSFGCALSKVLQSAKSTINGMTGSATSGLTTSISCSMKTAQTGTEGVGNGMGTNTTGLASGTSGSGALSGTGQGGSMAYGSGGYAMGAMSGTPQNAALIGAGNQANGYKGGYRMPRTGGLGSAFQSTTDYVLLPGRKSDATDLGFSTFVVIGAAIVLVALFALVMKNRVFA